MEPKSKFYTDPVIVLDFQSLYPSMIIAYNLCYSTIMGKVKPGKDGDNTTRKLGVIDYPEEISESSIYNHKKKSDPYISPCGSVFCQKEVRHGANNVNLLILI
jgi:DNA polymerase zeta